MLCHFKVNADGQTHTHTHTHTDSLITIVSLLSFPKKVKAWKIILKALLKKDTDIDILKLFLL